MLTGRRTRNPRVLYMSFFFPPSRASGVYRGRATANYLARHGWDVTVFAAPLDFLYRVIGSVDEQLTTTIDSRVRLHRPRMSLFPWEHDLRRYSRFRGLMPIPALKLHQVLQRYLFPEGYGSWGRSAVGQALRMHSRTPFDVVLATGNPFAAFAAAWMFNRLTHVPYIVDYRDSWTLNLFDDGPAFPPGHPAWRWERRVLKRASGIVFVNEALRAWHADRYPAQATKMMVVPNGWDPDLFDTDAPAEPARSPSAPLNFAYLGTITAAQPVEELGAAFRRAREHPELADARLSIHGHLGFFRNSQAELLNRLGLDAEGRHVDDDELGPAIRYRGPVSKLGVSDVYRDSDVLVFMAAGTGGGARYITSGKVFEYMASGRPIVSVHAPDIAAREVLEGYPLWFNAHSLDISELAQTMIAAGKAARDMTAAQREAAQRHAASYTRDVLLATLEQRMRALLPSRRRGGGSTS
jgi:glycosyltransferase involved in cell wall biosynthesis